MKKPVEMLSSLKERQRVPVGSALVFPILFSAVASLLTFKCVSWHKVPPGGQDGALITREQRQCRSVLCLGSNLAYQLACLLKIFRSECCNHQVLVVIQGELNLLWGGGFSQNGGQF